MARDLFQEAGISSTGQGGRDLFAEAGIDAKPSRSVIDIVSGGIGAIADDVTSGRAAVRKRERDEAMARANEAGAAMLADQSASGTYDELQQRAAQIEAGEAAKNSPLQAGIDSARDIAISGVKGAANTFVKLPLAATGVLLDATGARDVAERVGIRNQEALQSVDAFGKSMDALKSDSGKARDAIIDSTKGFTDTLLTLGARPAIIVDQIAESLVGTAAVGATAGVAVKQVMPKIIAQAEAAGLTGAAAEAFIAAQATKVAIGAAAAGEGVQAGLDVAGTAQTAGRTIGQYGLPALAAGAGTAAIGAASGGIARKLGIGDIETDIALRGTRGAAKTEPGFLVNRAAVEGFKEGALEEMPQSMNEAAMENIAMGRPWDEGLGKAAATGLATGAGMGGGHAALSRQSQDTAAEPADGGAPPAGSVAAADLLGTPGAPAPAPTEADKALYTPKNLTALDRVNEIDAKLPAATSEESSALQAERDQITASWPKYVVGDPTMVTLPSGSKVSARWAVVDASEPAASHDIYGNENPQYDKELQPRARGDRHAYRLQVAKIQQNIDPELLYESPLAGTGAPILRADGLVVDGNGRESAIQAVYQANGLKADVLRNHVRANAQNKGIPAEAIAHIKNPQFVRVIDHGQGIDYVEFSRQANGSIAARMSPSEQAKSDAAQIDSLDDLNPDEAGEFMSGSSTPFVRRFLAKLAGTESAGLIDASGRLSQTGYTRIRNAVLAKAYGDSPVLLRMVESLDDNTRNVSKALLRVAPQVAKAREAMGEGALHNVDLIPDLMAAVEELSDLKEKGVSIDQAIAQAGMFGDKISPEAQQILVLLNENARSPRRIADFIQAYLDALTAAGNPGQGSMFDDNTAPSKSDLMTAARRTTNADTATSGTNAGDAKPAQKGGSQPGDAPRDQAGNGGNEAAGGSAAEVGGEWQLFKPETGTLGIPRAEMPQIKGDHRGALIQFLAAKGITHETVELPASELKPTQAEYSTEKVAKWGEKREGVDRSVLASSDGYILDGHHQWVYALGAGETEQVIRFSAPIRELLAATFQFPSVRQSEGGNVTALRSKARQDFKDALGDLATIASKHTRAAMLPENTPNLMPTLIKLSGAAIAEVGYQIKDIIAHVKQALRSNEEFKKFWNKIDNAIYRKAAEKAAEKASLARVDDLFSMAEERKGQVDLFSQPPAKKAVDPQSWEERSKGNYKPPALDAIVPADVATRVRAMIAKWQDNLPEASISAEDRVKAEALLEPVMAAAKKDEPVFDARVKEIAAEAGIGHQLGPTKKIGRTAIKLVEEKFTLEEMKDIVRATIVVNSYDDAQGVLDAITKRFKVTQINNKTALEITAPDGAKLKNKGVSPEGYADVTAFVRLPGGGIAEIQINIPEMLSAKLSAHVLYEGSRVVEDDPARQGEYAELRDGQRDVYQAALDSSLTRLASATDFKKKASSELPPLETGAPLSGTSSTASSSNLNQPPSGNLTNSSPPNDDMNLQPAGNLSGTFISSTPFNDSIAKPGAEVYTDGKEKSSGDENGQNGDTGSGGAQGEKPSAASATGRPGPAAGVRDGAGGLSTAKVKEVIDYLVKGLSNPPITKHVATVADLPFAAPADTAGVFWGGKVWMVAANITSAEHAREVFAHETLGHYGLRGFFGAMLDGALSAIHDRNPRVRLSATEWKARNADVIETYKSKYGMTDADVHALAIEEAMSNWAQERGPIKGALRLVALLQKALRAMGMKAWANTLEAKTNAEALDMLRKARMFVRDGTKLDAPKVDAIYPAMADPTLADDLTRQEKWLDREAKLRGFKSIDDLAEKNYKVFENLAALWRKQNPVDAALMSRKVGAGGTAFKAVDVASAAFKRWFGDSKVVDADGKPLRVYHGTPEDFVVFDHSKTWNSTLGDSGGLGFFFSDSAEEAGHYARSNRLAGQIMPVYLSIKNPKVIEKYSPEYDRLFNSKASAIALRKDLMAQGYDGARTHLGEYVAFSPEQIKSAVSNTGAFDPKNPAILFSRAGQSSPVRNSQTANRTADDIIAKKAGTARPIDAVMKGITQAVRLDRLTMALYNKGAFLLDRYTPETIKAGLVSDYGIPESVTDMRAVVQGRQKQQTRAAGVLLDRLATLTRAEARVAYEWMNSADPQSSDWFMDQLPPESIKTLAEVEKMIDDLSKEAVALGQLDPEAYKRNRFAYLRRSYAKHEAELTKGETAMRKRAISILGDQYKGRGMTDPAPMRQIQNLAPEWWNRKTVAGKADKQLKGERFIRLERRANVPSQVTAPLVTTQGPVQPGAKGTTPKGKLLEIAYWPASEPMPASYGSWDQAGTWEVIDTKGADLIMWRDFTKQERVALGEIDEVRYAIAKTLHGMIHDVETGKYLQWLAQNHGKKEGEKFDGTIVEASDRMRDVFKPGEWVQVPDTVIPGTRVKKYGTLAGRYLPGPIWNDVRQVVGFRFQPLGETYAKIHRAWKTSKTALSPAVHMNNVMANFVMSDWHDVTAGHILKALKLMMSKDPAAAEVIARFSDSGGSIGTWAAKELQQDQMRPIIEALEKELGLAGNIAGQVGVMSALQLALKGQFPSAWEALKPSTPGKAAVAAARAMIDMYEAEDQVFRLAAWLRAKESGATDLAAGKLARKSFLDYSINAPWVQMLRSTALPFVAFTYRAVPMLMETAAKKPWKLMKLGMLAGAINAMGYMLSGGDEDDERKLLPEEKAGRVWGIVPKLIRMPWNDANGSPVFADIRRYVPVGDVFDVGQSHSALPMLPGMTPGGPLAVLAELALNKVQFTGKDIRLETDTTAEGAAKVADHLYKAFAPNIILLPGTYAFTGAMNAGTGKTDTFGREQSLAQAVASSVGVKVASYPKDVLQLNAQREAQFKMMEIERNITALKREYQKKGLTADEFQAKAADQMAKKRKVMEDLQKKAGG